MTEAITMLLTDYNFNTQRVRNDKNAKKDGWPSQILNSMEWSREWRNVNHHITATGNIDWNC